MLPTILICTASQSLLNELLFVYLLLCRVNINGHRVKVNIFDMGGLPFFYEVHTYTMLPWQPFDVVN